jgi:hypothetical protein
VEIRENILVYEINLRLSVNIVDDKKIHIKIFLTFITGTICFLQTYLSNFELVSLELTIFELSLITIQFSLTHCNTKV